MYLVNSLLQKPTAIYSVASGSFSRPDVVEFAVIRGTSHIDIIQVYNGPLGTGLKCIVSCDTFSKVRTLESIRVAGDATDMLAITSDSGAFILARLSPSGVLERVFLHTYGKSGCRRTMPGHLMTVDPLGRAVFLSALESNRIVYIVEREGADSEQAGIMKVRSPLEANRPNHFTLAARFLHCPLNPRIAILERDFAGKSLLSVFEVELGLNHVVKKATCEVDSTAYDIMPLSNGDFVVFLTSKSIMYRLVNNKSIDVVQSQPCPLLVTSFTKNCIIQFESGELFDYHDMASFGTISPCHQIVELNGLLFSASVSGDHGLYQLSSDGVQIVDSLTNIAPLVCGSFVKTRSAKREDSLQLYAGVGSHKHSSFELVKPGLSIKTVASSGLPETPLNILKVSSDLYAVGSQSSTMFLRVGDSLEEDVSPPFSTNTPYLVFSELAENGGLLAVCPTGWRQTGGKTDIEFEGSIVCACANSRQLAIILSDSQLIYFELSSGGQMRQVTSVKFPSNATCMAFAPIPAGRQRSRFLMIGGDDSIVRLLSCDPSDRMSQLALQAAAKPPSSVSFTAVDDRLYAHIGLRNGVYVRLTVDKTSGALNDPQSRYLGAAPIIFHDVRPTGHLIAYCTKPYLIFSERSRLQMVPMACEGYFGFAAFSTPAIPNSILAISRDHFSILMVDNHELPFNGRTKASSLMTVKRVNYSESLGIVVCVESDNSKSRIVLYKEDCSVCTAIDHDNSVTSAILTQFEGKPEEWFLVFGTSSKEGQHELYTYTFNHHDNVLSVVHTTECADKPNVMIPFAGKLLVGSDTGVRLYDLGKKRLLRKCELLLPSAVYFLDSQGLRVYAGTSMSSVMFLIYRPVQNQIQCFADDIANRPLSAMCVIDYETVCIADRLGCVSVLRLPNGLTESMEKDPAGLTSAARETLFAAPYKLERVCEYTVGDIITSLSKGTMFMGARQSLLYTTISGAIGMFTPIQYRSISNTLQTIESELRMCMHEEDSLPKCSLTGRHQLLRRSACGQTVRGVIDGQFCLDAFTALPADQQARIADAADKSVEEVFETLKSAMQIL